MKEYNNNNQKQINDNYYIARRELMAKQYEEKFEKEKNRGMTKEAIVEAKIREEKRKRMEEYEKNNPRDQREFTVS